MDIPTEGATDIPMEGATDIPTEGATDIPMEGATDIPTEGAMDILTEGATVILMEVTHILTTFTTLTTHTHPILTLTVALVILKSCKVCTAISSDLVATSNYTHCVFSCFPCFNIVQVLKSLLHCSCRYLPSHSGGYSRQCWCHCLFSSNRSIW